MSVRVLKDTGGRGLEALARRIGKARDAVLIGVPSGKTEPDGKSSAQVAAWLEFGTSRSPERPFLRVGIRSGLETFRRLARVDLVGIAEGTLTMDAALERQGAVAAGKVKEGFTTGEWAPNAPSTIERKGSDRPGIDTGAYRQSITYQLDKGAQLTLAGAGE
jgi:hypothetical protein